MKSRFTCLILALSFCLLSQVSFSQTAGDYQSAATGAWNVLASWERFDGSVWVGGVGIPNSGDGVITIRSGHNISITAGVTADQVLVASGGTLTSTSGQTLTLANDGGDDLIIQGTMVVGGGAPSIAGPGTTLVDDGGTLNIAGGSTSNFTTAITVANLGTVNLSNPVTKIFGANLTNNGTFNWTAYSTGGTFQINSGVTFTNNGTLNEVFDLTGAPYQRGFLPFSSGGSFINNGAFNKTTINEILTNGVTFTNNGTIDIATGRLLPNGNFTNSSTGIISGNGSITVSGTFVNDGQVSPGNSPGILTANPATIQATNADVYIEILDASGAGTGHDQLALTGNTNLDGVTITVRDITGNNSAPLGVYTILTTTGTFSGTPTMDLGSNFIPVTLFPASGNTIQVQKTTILPVVWGGFTALAKHNNSVELKWSTLQENNVSNYVVEYSTDGTNYTAIGNVSARGNASDVSNYSFVHSTPDIQKVNLYRIRQIDFDGKSTMSEIRPVKFNKGFVVPVLATPNPVHERLQLFVQAEGIRVMLIDMSGRTIERTAFQPGNHEINMSSLAPGVYQLVIFQDGKKLETQKIVKQ